MDTLGFLRLSLCCVCGCRQLLVSFDSQGVRLSSLVHFGSLTPVK